MDLPLYRNFGKLSPFGFIWVYLGEGILGFSGPVSGEDATGEAGECFFWVWGVDVLGVEVVHWLFDVDVEEERGAGGQVKEKLFEEFWDFVKHFLCWKMFKGIFELLLEKLFFFFCFFKGFG